LNMNFYTNVSLVGDSILYRVIELVGDIADMAERVGRRIQVLLSH